MAEYISGEKHRAMAAGHSANNTLPKPVLAAIVIVVLMGLSFYGGVAYQKSHPAKTTAAAGLNGGIGRGRFGGGQRPTIGQVTAVSAGSITVQNSSSGASTTLGITGTTQITNNGQTATAGSIQVGDNVIVAASTTDKTQAARILVNPSFGGGASSNNSPSTPTPAVTN